MAIDLKAAEPFCTGLALSQLRKEEELTAFRMQTHPLEFQMYYSL